MNANSCYIYEAKIITHEKVHVNSVSNMCLFNTVVQDEGHGEAASWKSIKLWLWDQKDIYDDDKYQM